MDPRNGKLRIGHHLGQALTGQGLAYVAAGDVLLEPGENCLKGPRRIAEQGGIGDAARIEGTEHNAGVPMQTPVQLLGGNHVAELAVLVSLTGLKSLAIGHGDWRLEAGLEAGEIAQVGRGRDWNLAAQLLGIGGDRAHDHHPPRGVGRAFEILKQQLDQQEMAQMVGGHRDFIALRRPFGLLQARLVDGGINHQGIEGQAQGSHQGFHPHAHALKIAQVDAQVVNPGRINA